MVRTSENVTVVEGHDVVLVCKVEGYPIPHVTWIAPSRAVLRNRTIDANLTLTNVSRSSNGMYECVATNELGSDSMRVNVIVWCKYLFLKFFNFLEVARIYCH